MESRMMSANSDESATRASVTCAAVVDGASTSDGVADNSTGDVSEGCRIDDPSRNDNTRVCGDGGIILHKNTSFCHEGGKAGEDGISAPQTNVNTGEYDDGSVVFKLGQGNQEDFWDDSLLIQAYEAAVSTFAVKEGKRQSSNKKFIQQKRFPWKAGDKCRAVWSEDGEIYDATIESVAECKEWCTICFTDYGNCEDQPLSALLPPMPQSTSESLIQTSRSCDNSSSGTSDHYAAARTQNAHLLDSHIHNKLPNNKVNTNRAALISTPNQTHDSKDDTMDDADKHTFKRPKFMNTLQSPCETTKPRNQPNEPYNLTWKPGDRCRCRYCVDGNVYDCEIDTVSRDGRTCTVFFPSLDLRQYATPLSELLKVKEAASSPITSSEQEPDVKDTALANMLMGWYQSGYYTGYYQAIQHLARQ